MENKGPYKEILDAISAARTADYYQVIIDKVKEFINSKWDGNWNTLNVFLDNLKPTKLGGIFGLQLTLIGYIKHELRSLHTTVSPAEFKKALAHGHDGAESDV